MQNEIKTIIWDLDNTLYKFTDTQIRLWHEGVVKYMLSEGVDLDMEDAINLAHQGWVNHRDSNHYFIENYGISARDAHIGMFKHIDKNMIAPCTETPSLMDAMRNHHHVILTYATREWAHRILAHTGLDKFFHPDFVLGAEDYNFEDKAHSPRGILTALNKIGGNANEVMFVEDTLPNLKTAKANAPVITTYLHHDRAMNDNMDDIDLVVRDTPELLKWFKELPEV
jgi:phosphoglycolate phosphatase-like HAD superfamily hydrolase